jgi:hypothetical protein
MSAKSLPLVPYLLAAIPAIMASIAKEKKVPTKRLIAAFLYGAILMALASWRMDIASSFAWVGAITSLLVNGDVLFAAINRSV